MAKVSPGTVKNRLKSLQIEYYSSHRLSKMSIHSLNSVNEIKERENEICVVSQIYVDDELIAYYPYVLVGKYIKKMNLAKNFFPRIAEAISEQLTACYLQKFKGGDWLFGDKFAHLIEKIEQLSVSTFEGEYFSTGVIVSSNFAKYFQGGKYAAYHFKGFPQFLFMVYQEIFCRWLSKTGNQLDERRPIFDIYRLVGENGYMEIDICFPLK